MRSVRLARLAPLALIFGLLAPLACSDDSGDGGDVLASPQSGLWSFVGSAPIDDTCNYQDLYVDPPGTFTLTNNGDETFTIDDGTNVFDCELDGESFSCPDRLTGTNDVGAGLMLDAVVEYTVSVTGNVPNDTQMNGRQNVSIVCNGADCAALEALVGVMTPCGWGQEFTAQAQ